MSIYTIGDLHLSFGMNKPMDIFGVNWEDHYKKIENDWLNKVNEGLMKEFTLNNKIESVYKQNICRRIWWQSCRQNYI